ncbi:MAG TPA: hypothetical protein VJH97_05795 [Candidatus Nanoarchaeia archaeon]|nr:hypothetical protein [Candidatus Nanoarchaeia archaeon]
MKTTKVQKYILYALGKWFEEANSHIKNKPLAVSINKVQFIELVQKAEIAQKQQRALYKNLEILEKKKFVKYANKELELTVKGERLFLQIEKEIGPYIQLRQALHDKNPVSYTKKVQTIFK